jgi:ABC-type multidrug transport system fused ATPase/permease subunit
MVKSLISIGPTLKALNLDRTRVAWVMAMSLCLAALEGVGIGLLVPLMEFLEKGSAAFSNGQPSRIWRVVLYVLNLFPIQPSLLALLALAFIPILARQGVRYLHQVSVAGIKARTIASLRKKCIETFLTADLSFHTSRRKADLLNALMTDAERGGMVVSYIVKLWTGVLLLAVYVAVLMALSPWATPVVLLAMAIVAILVKRLIEKAYVYGQRVWALQNKLHGSLAEHLAGIRLVKLRSQERTETAKVHKNITELEDTALEIARGQEAIEAAVEPLMMLGAFATLYMAVVAFGMTLASLGIFLLIFLRILPLIKQSNVIRQQIGGHIESLRQLEALTRAAQERARIHSGVLRFQGLRDAMEFDRVSFLHRGSERSEWALRDISFCVKKGSLTAIVGRSGSGKSTLLDLISRLQEPSAGSIRLNGVLIQEFEINSYRRAVGVVDQEGVLFNDTIANNIAYGTEGASQDAIMKAAGQAYAHQFIQDLPDGYRTVVGEQGAQLSVGQRQRINIARALFQSPDILLLDEPTSALDAESEQYIRDALDRLRGDKTILIVAHRLSTIRGADQILVLDRGRIIEQGDHAGLLKELGAYKQLFEMQIQREVDPTPSSIGAART